MKARLHDLSFSRDGASVLSITTREDCRGLWDDLNGTDVEVTIKKARNKRSLDANGLYWASLTELARRLEVSNAYMHNSMIRQYGQPEMYGEKVAYIMLPDTDETEQKALEADTYHIKPTSQTREGKDGVTYRAYMLMRGSSTYNTEEFSRLLDGLLEACRSAGVHVMTGREE
jgi:hypothetical protein